MKIGLYVHIPFCKMKCYYCDFLSFPSNDPYSAYVEALVKELKAYAKMIKDVHTISSIFIGGGTPTVLPPFLLETICETIKSEFTLESNYEWTIEANPGTILKEHAKVFKACGVNRVSLGLQAYQDHLLKGIGRMHTFEDWRKSIEILKGESLCNINTDLMFSLPRQTLEEWKETLNQVTAYKIPHISAYALIIEEGTPFFKRFEKGELILPSEEVDRAMYHYADWFLKEKGYNQYEISNWAKEDLECKHNILYWEGREYIGAGLGAHGYLAHIRYSNTRDIKDYIAKQNTPEALVISKETINQQMEMEEFMFLGLRMLNGISKNTFKKRFGIEIRQVYSNPLKKWIDLGALIEDGDCIKLTTYGLDIANQVYTSFLL